MPDREWRYNRVTLPSTVTITSVPCLVKGAYVNSTLSAHDCEIQDGGGTNAFTIPKSAIAGNAYAFGPARFENKLVVTPDASSTGGLTVVYVPLREDHA